MEKIDNNYGAKTENSFLFDTTGGEIVAKSSKIIKSTAEPVEAPQQ